MEQERTRGDRHRLEINARLHHSVASEADVMKRHAGFYFLRSLRLDLAMAFLKIWIFFCASPPRGKLLELANVIVFRSDVRW